MSEQPVKVKHGKPVIRILIKILIVLIWPVLFIACLAIFAPQILSKASPLLNTLFLHDKGYHLSDLEIESVNLESIQVKNLSLLNSESNSSPLSLTIQNIKIDYQWHDLLTKQNIDSVDIDALDLQMSVNNTQRTKQKEKLPNLDHFFKDLLSNIQAIFNYDLPLNTFNVHNANTSIRLLQTNEKFDIEWNADGQFQTDEIVNKKINLSVTDNNLFPASTFKTEINLLNNNILKILSNVNNNKLLTTEFNIDDQNQQISSQLTLYPKTFKEINTGETTDQIDSRTNKEQNKATTQNSLSVTDRVKEILAKVKGLSGETVSLISSATLKNNNLLEVSVSLDNQGMSYGPLLQWNAFSAEAEIVFNKDYHLSNITKLSLNTEKPVIDFQQSENRRITFRPSTLVINYDSRVSQSEKIAKSPLILNISDSYIDILNKDSNNIIQAEKFNLNLFNFIEWLTGNEQTTSDNTLNAEILIDSTELNQLKLGMLGFTSKINLPDNFHNFINLSLSSDRNLKVEKSVTETLPDVFSGSQLTDLSLSAGKLSANNLSVEGLNLTINDITFNINNNRYTIDFNNILTSADNFKLSDNISAGHLSSDIKKVLLNVKTEEKLGSDNSAFSFAAQLHPQTNENALFNANNIKLNQYFTDDISIYLKDTFSVQIPALSSKDKNEDPAAGLQNFIWNDAVMIIQALTVSPIKTTEKNQSEIKPDSPFESISLSPLTIQLSEKTGSEQPLSMTAEFDSLEFAHPDFPWQQFTGNKLSLTASSGILPDKSQHMQLQGSMSSFWQPSDFPVSLNFINESVSSPDSNETNSAGKLTLKTQWQQSADDALSLFNKLGIKGLNPAFQENDVTEGNISTTIDANWKKSEGKPANVTAQAKLDVSNLSAFIGKFFVQNLSTDAVIQLWPKVRTYRNFPLNIGEVNPGIALYDFKTEVDLTPSSAGSLPVLTLKNPAIRAFNGNVSSGIIKVDLNHLQSEFVVSLTDVDLAEMLLAHQIPDVRVTGKLQGNIPVKLSGEGPVVTKGRIETMGPGEIQYNPQNADSLTKSAPGVDAVLLALQDYQYTSLSSDVTYEPDGNLLLAIQARGKSPLLSTKRPVNLNINLEQNIKKLLYSLRLINDVNNPFSEQVEKYYQP